MSKKSELLPDEMETVQGLISKNTDIFALDDNELGRCEIVYHEIDTGTHPPIKLRPYRIPPGKNTGSSWGYSGHAKNEELFNRLKVPIVLLLFWLRKKMVQLGFVLIFVS